MRNSAAKKDANRQLILQAAGRLFREKGIEQVGVADVMRAAGMTHGGFYRHFSDKSDLATQAISQALAVQQEAAINGAPGIPALAESYLNSEHRDSIGSGCVFAALGSETARGHDASRAAMSQAIRSQIDFLAAGAAGKTDEQRRQIAVGSWSAMIGALILSRISEDATLSEEILHETKGWLLSQQTSISADRP
ncbi:TetR/AcrR family transcriptional regulator [Rhizobium johnstonii]|jgi:TetR/AcrR family transcriptional repressor of nem operon|uniref:TetR/AcrR family transcriptional regulator n=1 Tax=Rhizobium leguminosarum TaxID=384 RepID=A0A4Q8XPK3_RHILE|nr:MULTISPECIES: TetR/AcrR family transcriptional regulator [Rhizobium]MDV4165868.1 TetR/AcrR family transcriptional regulator [Rhizobium leguminosarum]MDV4176352.1 TetR/AcrR family transcriptional regulator [Rhizobium leguminosarum]OAV57278.1 hypothetical protein A6U98_35210 [Rhizobium sp. WYCCWR10014]QIO56047.1 TetR/AcrR family transcriptional regulator [Rhizobium leguminosarum bv. trifolii]QIO70357.1 TetR/AcrR family transcriptional regulator [Rhizobium leguminosarum bv. trifolii]